MDENRGSSDGRENPKRMRTGFSLEDDSSSSNNSEGESNDSLSNHVFLTSEERQYGLPRLPVFRNIGSIDPDRIIDTMNPRSDDEDQNPDDIFEYNSPESSDSTLHGTDSDDDAEDREEHPVMSKEKPKHNWFVVPEIINRQIGYSSKYNSNDLFQRRCYGSLHCVQRLELMNKLQEHTGCVNCLNFHPNGNLLASGSDDRNVVVWDWRIGKCLFKYNSKHKQNVFQTKFMNLSGDLHIASCAKDGLVRLAHVSPDDGVRYNRRLGSHKGPCHKLAVLPDQHHVILSAGEDGVVLSHDVRDSKPERIVTTWRNRVIALYSIHANPLRTMEFCVCGRDDQVRVYDRRNSKTPLAIHHPFKNSDHKSGYTNLHITSAVYNYDGTEILASYSDAEIYLFDVNDKPSDFKHRYQGHRNSATIKGVNFFGPKSEFIVSGSDCGNVYFWEKQTEAIVQWMMADDNGVVNVLEPHPQLPFICTSGLDWDVKLWVPSSEKEPAMAGLSKTVKRNAKDVFSPSDSDLNESQMLWMLWRHMRSANRVRRDVTADENILFNFDPMSDSSTSSMSSRPDSLLTPDDLDEPTGCSTS